MVIFHSYVSLPEGIWCIPQIRNVIDENYDELTNDILNFIWDNHQESDNLSALGQYNWSQAPVEDTNGYTATRQSWTRAELSTNLEISSAWYHPTVDLVEKYPISPWKDWMVKNRTAGQNLPVWFLDSFRIQICWFCMSQRNFESSYDHPMEVSIVRGSEITLW